MFFYVMNARLASWYPKDTDVVEAWLDGKDFQNLLTGQYFSIRDAADLYRDGCTTIFLDLNDWSKEVSLLGVLER